MVAKCSPSQRLTELPISLHSPSGRPLICKLVNPPVNLVSKKVRRSHTSRCRRREPLAGSRSQPSSTCQQNPDNNQRSEKNRNQQQTCSHCLPPDLIPMFLRRCRPQRTYL